MRTTCLTRDRAVVFLSAREAEELAALLRSPDAPTYRWPVAAILKEQLTTLVASMKGPQPLASPADQITMQLVQSAPQGLNCVQLKELTGIQYAVLQGAINELCEQGVLKTCLLESEPRFFLSETFDPMSTIDRVMELPSVEDVIVKALETHGGPRFRKFFVELLNQPYSVIDVALAALVEKGLVQSKLKGNLRQYDLAGDDDDEPTKKSSRSKGSKSKSKPDVSKREAEVFRAWLVEHQRGEWGLNQREAIAAFGEAEFERLKDLLGSYDSNFQVQGERIRYKV